MTNSAPIMVAAALLMLTQYTLAQEQYPSDRDEISSRKTGDDTYVITLKSGTVTSVAGATQRLAPKARALCGDRFAKLGRYKFEHTEPVTGENWSGLFIMEQAVSCVDSLPEDSLPEKATDSRSPQLSDEQAVESVREQVRELSLDYFTKRYSHLGSDASAAFSTPNANADGESDTKSPTAAGTPVEINLYQITVYDNPQNAPSKGIYVAVDYDNRVGNIAHHCGYLMWHSPDAVEFKLGRVESGTLDESLVANIAPEKIPPTLKALRCSNFYGN